MNKKETISCQELLNSNTIDTGWQININNFYVYNIKIINIHQFLHNDCVKYNILYVQ